VDFVSSIVIYLAIDTKQNRYGSHVSFLSLCIIVFNKIMLFDTTDNIDQDDSAISCNVIVSPLSLPQNSSSEKSILHLHRFFSVYHTGRM